MIMEEISQSTVDLASQMFLELWPESNLQEERENCQRILDSGSEEIFIGFENSSPIGFIYLSIRNDYVEGSNSSPVAYIEGILVREEHRNKGFARQLTKKAEAWGRKRGLSELGSDAEIKNKSSVEFHKKVGFLEVNRVVCFLKKI